MNQPKEIARQTVNYMLNNGMDPVAAAHLLISTIADECFPHIGMIEIDRKGTHLLWRAGYHLALQQPSTPSVALRVGYWARGF